MGYPRAAFADIGACSGFPAARGHKDGRGQPRGAIGAKQKAAVALVRAGKTYAAAGKKVGLTRSAVAGACGRTGLKTGRGAPRCEIDWRKEFAFAIARGESQAQMARRLNVYPTLVSVHRRKHGIILVPGSSNLRPRRRA